MKKVLSACAEINNKKKNKTEASRSAAQTNKPANMRIIYTIKYWFRATTTKIVEMQHHWIAFRLIGSQLITINMKRGGCIHANQSTHLEQMRELAGSTSRVRIV